MEEECIRFLQQIRWQGMPKCPYCASSKCCPIETYRFHCNSCNTAFSVTVNTIFHQTRLPLTKWFEAITLILDAPNYISSRNLAMKIGVNKHTGYRILQQIDKALLDPAQRVLIHQIHSQKKGGNNV